MTANNLDITNVAGIFSDTFGPGKGGKIGVTITEKILLSGTTVDGFGSTISSSSFGDGPGGNIEVEARQINLKDHALIAATSFSGGDAGNILLKAKELQSVNSSVTTQADFADGGNIKLAVGSIVELVNSEITATVGNGFGKGGNITIDPTFVILNNSDITANGFGGPGGNITIIANTFLATPDSSVAASSALSTPGTVDIQAPITDLSGSLAPLPETVVQAASLLRQSCAARYGAGKPSSLVVGARDSLPVEPGAFMPSSLYRAERDSTPSSLQHGTEPNSPAYSLLALVNPLLSSNSACTK